nr:hypothetical protein [Tanacetum cinerariifolium]
MFTDSTTKVDSEPPSGSNEDITNPYECKQSLDVSAVQASDLNVNKMASTDNTSGPALQRKERFIDPAGSPSSITIDQDVPSTSTSPITQEIQYQVTHQGAEEQIHGHQNPLFDNAPLLHNLSSDLSFEETTVQGFIPSNLHHLNQSFGTLSVRAIHHPSLAPAMAPPTHTYESDLASQQMGTCRKKDTARYICQLDEKLFDLTKDTLKDAHQITPVKNNNPFSSPPTPDALINFVNNLGYPKVFKTLSTVVTNNMFLPWRTLTTIINLCLTGRTLGFEIPRELVLQIL